VVIEYLASLTETVNFTRIIAAIAVLLIFVICRSLFVKLLLKAIEELLDKTVKKYKPVVNYMVKPLRFLVIVLGICLAFSILEVQKYGMAFSYRILNSLIALSIIWILYSFVDGVTSVIKENELYKDKDSKIDEMFFPFIRNGIKIIIVVLGSITILQQWTDNIAGLITGLGIGSLAIALAAKDMVANLFGGLTIMLDRTFKVGDWIMAKDVEGNVEDIGFRSTRIRTIEQSVVTIPNSLMTSELIVNYSRRGKRRVRQILKVSTDTSIEKISECVKRIKAVLENHPNVHSEGILVNIDNFGDYALEIQVCYFTKTAVLKDYLNIKEKINFEIMKILNELGIRMALHPGVFYSINK